MLSLRLPRSIQMARAFRADHVLSIGQKSRRQKRLGRQILPPSTCSFNQVPGESQPRNSGGNMPGQHENQRKNEHQRKRTR